jgi:tetratricopeptide (TPR) repeat protein
MDPVTVAAVRQLDELVRAARPDDDRISGDPAAARELAEASDGLPLALQVMAALLVADPLLTVAELVIRVTDEVRRLEGLRRDDGSGAAAPSVTATFELSYRQLDEDSGRMFRLLPANPGPDVSTGAAAKLAGWPTERARAALVRLTRAHLVEPGAALGRWRIHDLLRVHARQVPEASPGEREQAVDRLLAWYVEQADAAGDRLGNHIGMPASAAFTGRDDALLWLDAEWPNLIAAVTLAADSGRDYEAMFLPLCLNEYLDLRRQFDDWLTVLTVSLDSARRLNDKGNQGAALSALGGALQAVRRFDEAVAACQAAADIFREIGDLHHEGIALNNLGNALLEVRRPEEAVGACHAAVAIFQAVGDRPREGMAVNNLGNALVEVRRFAEAVSAHQAAAAIYQETGDRHGQAQALNNLGIALRKVRRFEEAVAACQAAAAAYQETGDQHGQGLALTNLGSALVEVRRFEEAVAACRAAAAVFREIGDQYGQGMALTNLGNAYREMRQPVRAAGCWREAAEAMRHIGNHEAAERLDQLAAHAQTGRRRGPRS